MAKRAQPALEVVQRPSPFTQWGLIRSLETCDFTVWKQYVTARRSKSEASWHLLPAEEKLLLLSFREIHFVRNYDRGRQRRRSSFQPRLCFSIRFLRRGLLGCHQNRSRQPRNNNTRATMYRFVRVLIRLLRLRILNDQRNFRLSLQMLLFHNQITKIPERNRHLIDIYIRTLLFAPESILHTRGHVQMELTMSVWTPMPGVTGRDRIL
jgi:hypothetical protein